MENKRIFEIDLLRVMAIGLMVVYHLVYDLSTYGNVGVNYEAPFWFWVGKLSALSFILVAGISSGMSRNSVRRGLKVFGFGMVLTVVTYFFDSHEYIRFGILHFLGVSMMLFPILNMLKKWQLAILGIIAFVLGQLAMQATVGTFLLLPFGLMYNGFSTMDYYPIFPYIADFILGILIFKLYYYKRKSFLKGQYNSKVINFISKNSLKIYLIHQPIILVIIYMINYLR